MDNELLFTPAALLDFLLQIDELANYEISVQESPNGVQVQIGDSSYAIRFLDAEPVEVPNEVVEEVGNINEETYQEIANTDYNQVDDEPVEAGIISELIKTLAVGGMVRLTGKLLGNDIKGK